MSLEVDNYSNRYIDWLKNNIETLSLDNGVVRITLPYLDKDNDEIELFIVPEDGGGFRITDDGATLNNLELGGFALNSKRRKDVFMHVVNSFAVEFNEADGSLQVHCDAEDMPLRKHMLAQCMVKVSDMFYLTQNNVQSMFLEDVKTFFDANNVRYIEDLNFTGKSKLVTHYDFAIPKSDKCPERLIQVVNSLDSVTAKTTVFSWNDTHAMRAPGSKLLVIVNDDKKPSGASITTLKQYDIDPILWSKKGEHINDFVA